MYIIFLNAANQMKSVNYNKSINFRHWKTLNAQFRQ